MAMRAKMTGWYDPGQLLRTGWQVLVSTLFGQNADPRLMEALAARDRDFYDFYDFSKDGNGRTREEIWIDYAADVGDGFDSTYTVAYYLSRAQLPVKAPGGQGDYATPLQRGELLVFGGDEVYPTSSRSEYRNKLVQPYEAALGSTGDPHPAVFAIPGNHDWYDSLVSFTRLFATRRWFAGWQTKQSRSYFAVKLPHGWWLVAADVQLFSDIDAPQVEYFRKVAEHMEEGDRVILCNAEPHWIYAKIYGKDDSDFNEDNLAFLEEKVLNKKIAVFLAGDLHHYRRHATDDKRRQKITAGGGGAFLHPTHGPDVEELAGGFRLRKSFPDPGTSKGICWRNLWFLYYNRTFGVLTAMLYLLTSWTVMADVSPCGWRDAGCAAKIAIHAGLQGPAPVFWGLVLFFGFVLFTDTRSKVYRWTAGPLHGLAHVLAAFLIGWEATYWTVSSHHPFGSVYQLLRAGGLIFAGGWIAGSVIMGLYLLVSLNLFQRHSNEAFSALKIADWKNFLKLRIDRNGALTIFPIGIRKVARRWTPGGGSAADPKWVPGDGSAPELIEAPIVLPGR